MLAAVKAEGFEYTKKHPTAVVKQLQLTHQQTKLFDKFQESTLGHWFSTDSNRNACWKESVLCHVLKESKQGGQGRSKKMVS
jgi:hypothetical protein